jgi:hypothetical protein
VAVHLNLLTAGPMVGPESTPAEAVLNRKTCREIKTEKSGPMPIQIPPKFETLENHSWQL